MKVPGDAAEAARRAEQPEPATVPKKRPPLPAKNIILYGPLRDRQDIQVAHGVYGIDLRRLGTPKSKEQFADDLVAEMAWWEVSILVLLDL